MNSYPPIRILVLLNGSVDGDQIRSVFNGHLDDFVFRFVLTRESFFEKLSSFNPHIVVIDSTVIGKGIGKFVQLIHYQYPDLKLIVMGDSENEQPIMDCIQAGADYFLFKRHLHKLPEIIQQNLNPLPNHRIISEGNESVGTLNSARSQLLEFANQHTFDELLRESIDQICQLTGSEVGFFHFLEADQKTISLQTWSTKTLQTYCKAEGKGLHYDIDQAGVWADCIREGHALIHNDYAILSNIKGLPEGHAPLLRELVVPIYRNGVIVAILGVGNKLIDYTEQDLKNVSYFTDLVWDIAARKKIEEQLRGSEARFKSFIENANDTVFTLDRDGILQYISPNFQEIHGFATEVVIGKSFQNFVYLDDIPYCNEFLKKVFDEGGKHSGLEYRILHKNGDLRWHTVSASLLQEEMGGVQTLLGISHDITTRKESEQQLVESEASIRKRLLAITTPDGDVDSLELADLIDWDALNSMMDDFCELTHNAIGIVDLHGKVLMAKGWQDICTKFHRCNPETLKNCMISDRELSQNVMPGTFKFYKCKNNMWDISTPLMLNNRHVGNIFMGQFFFEDEILDIEIFRKQAKRYGFDEDSYLKALNNVPRMNPETVATVMTFYTKLSSLISSLGFSNIQLARSLAEKNRILEYLQESEERYHNLVEYLPTPIFIVNQGIYTYANPAGLTNLGYKTLDELVGVHVMETIHPDSIPVLLQRIQMLENGQENEPMELKVLRKEGGVRLMESTSVQITLNGVPCSLILNHDITDRKQAEEKFQVAHERLLALWNVASLTDSEDPKIISDYILQTITRMTDSQYGFYGFVNDEETEMVIHSWSGQVMQECLIQDKARVFPIAEAGIWSDAVLSRKPILIQNYKPSQMEGKGLPEGHVSIKNLLVVPFLSNGKIIALATVANSQTPYSEEDVTQIMTFLTNVQSIIDRTRADQARLKSEILLNEAMQLMKTGAWEWDVVRRIITWSKEVYRIHAASPSEYPNESNALMDFSLNCYHPDDRLIVEEAFAECVNFGKAYTLEVRFQPLTGTEKWVRTIGKPVFEGEKVIRVNGYIMDITERKQAELELQKQQKLLESSQETAQLGSFEYDFKSNAILWTKEAYHIYGMDEFSSVPSNDDFSKLIYPEDIEKTWAAYQNSLSNGEKMDLVYRIIRSDGEIRFIHNLGFPEYDSSGMVKRFFGTFQDVTESKFLEIALQKSLEEKEVLLREVHHRVKNNLAAILGLIEMERFSCKDPKMEEIFLGLGRRIKSIATVHETLYKSDDLARIRFQGYLEALISNLVTSFQSEQEINLVIDAGEVELDLNLAVPCGLIINELVTNALKHAFPLDLPDSKVIHNAEIKVTLTQSENDFVLSVSDNGVGFPADLDIHAATSLGLRLLSMLGEHQLGGKLVLDRSQGTRITLTFSHQPTME
jgi:PAS domain S-box-containing protein